MRTYAPLILLLTACQDCRHEAQPEAQPSAMILVLDGVRSEEFTSDERVSDLTGVSGQTYASETWATLAPHAATLRAALNPGATITAPGHAQMVTGRIDSYANFAVSNGPGLYRPEYTTIFEEARSQLGLTADEAMFIGNTELLQGVVQSTQPGSAANAGAYTLLYDPDKANAPINDDDPIVEAIQTAVTDRRPRLLVANFHDVDRAGHYGAGDSYIEDVKKLDGLLPRLWTRLGEIDPEYRDKLMIFIVADHGRHRHENDEGWHNHGDSCSGCREIPMMILGPSVEEGSILKGNWTLLDLAPTLAAHVGFDVPWTQGLPIAEVLDGNAVTDAVASTARSGDVALSSDGTAWTRWLADDRARDEVIVDGEVVSTPGAMFAEGSTAFTGPTTRAACWRELSIVLETLYWPWTGKCRIDAGGGAGWVDVGFPDEVGTNWSPVFTEADGRLWAIYNQNPDGIGELGVDDSVGLRIRSWSSAEGWGQATSSAEYFPTDPTVVATPNGLLMAFGTNDAGDDARYTRHVRVLRATTLAGQATFAENGEGANSLVDIDLNELWDGARVERPALTASGTRAQLAVIGTTENENIVAVLSSDDAGETWGAPVQVSTDPVLPHLSPQWVGETLYWGAVAPDGDAEICRSVSGGPATCDGVGSTRLDSYSASTGTVVIDTGVAEWTRTALSR